LKDADAQAYVKQMRSEIKSLTAELIAVKSTRDTLQNENSELKKQCLSQARKIKKLTGEGN